jgi:poly(3-hydroxybutyrate) depolymerase
MGFRHDAIRDPVLITHGTKDKMVPYAHAGAVPDAGHITVLDSAPEALAWLAVRVRVTHANARWITVHHVTAGRKRLGLNELESYQP